MLAFLWKLIVGDFRQEPLPPPHQHEYEIINQLESRDQYRGKVTSIIYVSRCKTCGDIREDRVEA